LLKQILLEKIKNTMAHVLLLLIPIKKVKSTCKSVRMHYCVKKGEQQRLQPSLFVAQNPSLPLGSQHNDIL
jgi:hypothetical protein